MAHEWIKLICELRSHEIAHCDLQHGNVMVVDDRLVLVDYDGMFVPTMDTGDDEDRVAWENGLPAYQHPGRPGQLLSPAIDDFSAWVILISLRAVADDLSLWHRMIGQSEEESLLFTERGHQGPGPLAALARADPGRAGPDGPRMVGRAAAARSTGRSTRSRPSTSTSSARCAR